MSEEFNRFSTKDIYNHIEEFAAAFAKKTNLEPDKIKLIQKINQYKLEMWFEPLGVDEMEMYRARAESAEANNKRLREVLENIAEGGYFAPEKAAREALEPPSC